MIGPAKRKEPHLTNELLISTRDTEKMDMNYEKFCAVIRQAGNTEWKREQTYS